MRSLRHRNFRLFFTGQLVSLIGTWMQSVALSWLVYRLTGRATLLGIVALATQGPIVLLSSLGGVLADRVDPRRLVVITQALQMVQACLLAWLTLTGRIQVWQILVLAVGLGLANAFDVPARTVLVARTVEREDLPNAIALNSSIFHGTRILGPALAGLLVAAVGEGWCFLANAVSFLGAIAGLMLMRLPPWEPRSDHPPVFAHLLEGVRFVRGHRRVRLLLLLLAAVCLMGMPYTVLMPIFADGILHGGPRAMGLLMAASGLGAVLGAGTLAGRSRIRGLEKIAWLGAAAVGLTLACFAYSRVFWLSALLMVPVGLGMVAHMTSNNTLVQMLIPDEMRGRVMALYVMVFTAAMPLGAVIEGFAAHHIGAPLTVALGGLGCVIGAGLFAWRYPAPGAAARAASAQD
jgi:predicted MFS family arabinose efflux permease